MDRNDPVQQSNQREQVECTEPEKFSVRLNPVIDLDVGRNDSQALVIVLSTLAGGILAYILFDNLPNRDTRLFVAALGATAGLIVSFFLSGFILMLIPHRPVKLTRKEIVVKRKQRVGQTRSGAFVFLVAYFIPGGLLFIFMKPQMNLTDIILVSCGVTLIGFCCYLVFSSNNLEYSQCSICKARMENRIFKNHRCELESEDSNISPSA